KAETPAAAPPKAGGSKIVPILMVMNTLLVGGVLVFVMKNKSPVAVTAPASASAEGEKEKGEGEAKGGGEHGGGEGHGGGPGPMVKLENFVIQLKAVDSERYVRV